MTSHAIRGSTTPPGRPDYSNGRRFRSLGETQIARFLNRYRIPYLYEHPLAVVDQGKTKIWYPDFQLSGYGMLIEYCGRPDDPHYADGMAKKQRVYPANGLTALMVTPDIFRGDWPTRLLGQIQDVLKHRLESFQNSNHPRHLATTF